MSIKRLFKKHSGAIMGLFIVFILLFSTLSYVLNVSPVTQTDSNIVMSQDGRTLMKYQGYYIEVTHLPSQLQDLYENSYDFKDDEIFLTYYSNDNNITIEYEFIEPLKTLQAKLDIVETTATLGCIGNCSFSKIDCEYFDNVIVIKEAEENSYYTQKNCYFFETNDIEKTLDYILYKNAGLIK